MSSAVIKHGPDIVWFVHETVRKEAYENIDG